MFGEMSIQEQAKYYAQQGMIVRAAVLYKKLVDADPSAENLTALAEIYMEQGLFDDACALHVRAMGMTPTSARTGFVN